MIRVEMVDDLKLVSGKIAGDLCKEVARRYFEEVGKLANQHGLKRVLTDLREAYLKADEKDMNSLSKELAQLGVDSSYKRAVVVREDVRGYKQWENHCWSAGFKHVRLFVDNDAAMKWLAE